MHGLRIQACQQRHHVGYIRRYLVAHRVGQPVRLATPHDVGADDTVMLRYGARKRVEVASLPTQAVRANKNAGVARITPFPVRHAVQAARSKASNVVQAWFNHDHWLSFVRVSDNRC